VSETKKIARGAAAHSDPELSKAIEALEAERKVNLAEKAALARLEAHDDLDPNASDEAIEKHLTRTAVARTRVSLSDKRLAGLEAAKQEIAGRAAIAEREANYQRAVEDQAEAVAQFRAKFPEAMADLYRVLVGANLAESRIWDLAKKLPEGKAQPPSVFRFHGRDPVHVRVQLLDRGGNILWQGDENTDVASQDF
jgi:hypothetical protein